MGVVVAAVVLSLVAVNALYVAARQVGITLASLIVGFHSQAQLTPVPGAGQSALEPAASVYSGASLRAAPALLACPFPPPSDERSLLWLLNVPH